MKRKKLKLALVEKEMTHWQLAVAANEHLPLELHLSEYDCTRLANGRKNPTPEQADAVASVLGVAVEELFG